MTPHGPVFDTYLQVRLTTHDKERIKARALEAGLKTSEYVRKQALGKPSVFRGGRAVGSALANGVLKEAQASVALDGETMYEGHPAVVASKRQPPRNNP